MTFIPGRKTVLTAALVGTTLLASPILAQPQQQQPEPHPSGWTYTTEALATAVNNGYQLALDPVGRKVYLTDARWRTEDRAPDGTVTVRQTGTGKVVVFDTETRELEAIHSFLGLTRNDGSGPESQPFEWTDGSGDSITSMRTTFSPYGIAVAANAADASDPIIVTTTARARDAEAGYGGNVVIYNASQGAPTDEDRLFAYEDGGPIFNGIRRVAVNNRTGKAFVTNFADARGGGEEPGYITVIDLATRAVEANVRVPEYWGAIGVAVDEENDLVYVGTIAGEGLYVIDASALDTSDPRDLALNDAAITELEAVVGENARPTYNAELKRLYVSSFASPEGVITVVDADPQSAGYGTILDTIETGPTNAVEVDAERGLLFSANLGDKEVVVFSTDTHEEVLRLPTTGNALNVGIDPESGDVWVSNFGRAGFVDVFTLRAPQ